MKAGSVFRCQACGYQTLKSYGRGRGGGEFNTMQEEPTAERSAPRRRPGPAAAGAPPRGRTHEPAVRWRYLDGRGGIGVIPSVTDAFCASCDRVRLTAEGQLRACLFAIEETDLRGPLRSGATDDELAELIQGCVTGKWAGHGITQVDFSRPRRSMSQIGG